MLRKFQLTVSVSNAMQIGFEEKSTSLTLNNERVGWLNNQNGLTIICKHSQHQLCVTKKMSKKRSASAFSF